jgi:hypothetical protein
VTDVAKVRLGGWEIRRMGSVLCMCFFVFVFFMVCEDVYECEESGDGYIGRGTIRTVAFGSTV